MKKLPTTENCGEKLISTHQTPAMGLKGDNDIVVTAKSMHKRKSNFVYFEQ